MLRKVLFKQQQDHEIVIVKVPRLLHRSKRAEFRGGEARADRFA